MPKGRVLVRYGASTRNCWATYSSERLPTTEICHARYLPIRNAFRACRIDSPWSSGGRHVEENLGEKIIRTINERGEDDYPRIQKGLLFNQGKGKRIRPRKFCTKNKCKESPRQSLNVGSVHSNTTNEQARPRKNTLELVIEVSNVRNNFLQPLALTDRFHKLRRLVLVIQRVAHNKLPVIEHALREGLS